MEEHKKDIFSLFFKKKEEEKRMDYKKYLEGGLSPKAIRAKEIFDTKPYAGMISATEKNNKND